VQDQRLAVLHFKLFKKVFLFHHYSNRCVEVKANYTSSSLKAKIMSNHLVATGLSKQSTLTSSTHSFNTHFWKVVTG